MTAEEKKSTWIKCNLNVQNIVTETAKATLIQMPHKSDYDGYSFWHPSKLVRAAGGNGYSYTFSFTEDFKFTLKKYGKGKYNSKEVIDEKNIGADEIKEIFQTAFGMN